MADIKLRPKNTYPDDFKRLYVTGAVGGHFTGYNFRFSMYRDAIIQAEDPDTQPSAKREILAEIIMSPLALKELVPWLSKQLADIEKRIGEIKKPGQAKPPKEEDDTSKAYA